jgi:DNA mismatch repair protein MutS2
VNEKSLEMLEFPRVREIVAGYTSFAISRELAMALKPSHSYETVTRWLKQSAEAMHLLSIEPDLSIGGVYDIREATVLAARGKTLELESLLDIQKTLGSIRFLHNKLGRLAAEAPLLGSINSQIVTHNQLEQKIGHCISPSAELLDSASPKLAELRRMVKEKRVQILSRLDSVMKSREAEKLVQDPIVTERDGRYVIPVKVEMRRELKGIVHDISNTGATAFVEPMVTIDLGNELREAVIEEQHEVERILGELSAAVGEEEAAISQNLKLVAEIDLALAKARFADRFKATEPLISGVKTTEGNPGTENRILRLMNARHPLLKGKPVPLNIEIGRDFQGLVITGPNTGGKTVALKTVGLLSAMTQAGLPIPAASESYVPLYDNIFSDIGDEQSIEHTLSTFSWHIGNIVHILKQATDKSLVLMDELGTSTDPGEGAALAQSILLAFLDLGTMIVATTHFSELKAFAHVTPRLRNASLDFDPVTMAPTYHLTVGLPGGSNALAIASQLGLPPEIIERAREQLTKGSIDLEQLLSDLMQEKQTLKDMKDAIQKEKQQAEDLRRKLQEELHKQKEEEEELLRQTRIRLVHDGDELQSQIRDAMEELKKNKSKEKLEQAQKALAQMREQLKGKNWQPASKTQQEKSEDAFGVGKKVWLSGMNIQGTVVSAADGSGLLELQVGHTRLRVAPEGLEKADGSEKKIAEYYPLRDQAARRTASRELDLRGKRADEVEIELDAYLNDASLANMPEVRIIHGMATGTVRQIVRQFLASHPLVESFRSGKREEGGDGVTIARL